MEPNKKITKTVVNAAPTIVRMTPSKCKKLCAKAGIEYLDGYEERVIEHSITDETVDRAGDIIRAAGGDFKNYAKNSTILYVHNTNQNIPFPVGKSIKIWHDAATNSVKSYGLYLDDRVDTTGASTAVFNFVKSGAMPGCSIGFHGKEVNNPVDETERKEIGLGEYGVEFKTWEMLEYSICPIGCNPNALRNSLTDNMITAKDIKFAKENKLLSEEIIKQIIPEEKEEKNIELVESIELLIKSNDELKSEMKELKIEIKNLHSGDKEIKDEFEIKEDKNKLYADIENILNAPTL